MAPRRKHIIIVEVTLEQEHTEKFAKQVVERLIERTSSDWRTHVTEITCKQYSRYQQAVNRKYDKLKKRIPDINA